MPPTTGQNGTQWRHHDHLRLLLNQYFQESIKKSNFEFPVQSNLSKRTPPNNDHLSTTTTILASRYPHLEYKGTSTTRQKRPQFGVPMVVVVLRFDYIYSLFCYCKLAICISTSGLSYWKLNCALIGYLSCSIKDGRYVTYIYFINELKIDSKIGEQVK